MTITEIRARYPHPRRQPARGAQDQHAYCVGEAVLLAHGLWTRAEGFPGERELAQGLERLNPALVGQPAQEPLDGLEDEDKTLAYDYARHITLPNDLGDFARAWQVAEAALTWPHSPLHLGCADTQHGMSGRKGDGPPS